MEITTRNFSGKNYWKKKGYGLLDGAAARRRMQTVKIGGSAAEPTTKKRRFWRLRKAPKVLMKVTPKKLWKRFKESYFNLMLRVAGRTAGSLEGGGGIPLDVGKRSAKATIVGMPDKRVEAFESRLVLEIYKALATSRGLSEV